jgi:hypothetical protein
MDAKETAELEARRGGPCISIFISTSRDTSRKREGPIRVKNALKKAAKLLAGARSHRDVVPLLERLDALARTIDHSSTLDGVALFVGPGFGRKLDLPFPVQDRVVVAAGFAVQELVHRMTGAARSRVLVLGDKPTRLFEGVDAHLVEVRRGGFPLVNESPSPDPRGSRELRHRHRGSAPRPSSWRATKSVGYEPSEFRDEYRRHFFRDVDDALRAMERADPRPLIVVGDERALVLWREMSRRRPTEVEVVGSHERTPAARLGRLVLPPLRERLDAERRDRARDELGRAIKAHRVVTGVRGAGRAARSNRGALLLVDESFRARELESVIELVVTNGGEVVFLPAAELAAQGRVALVRRVPIVSRVSRRRRRGRAA